jgi:hypothetical protein
MENNILGDINIDPNQLYDIEFFNPVTADVDDVVVDEFRNTLTATNPYRFRYNDPYEPNIKIFEATRGPLIEDEHGQMVPESVELIYHADEQYIVCNYHERESDMFVVTVKVRTQGGRKKKSRTRRRRKRPNKKRRYTNKKL